MSVFSFQSMNERGPSQDFVADRHYYLTDDGRVVLAGDPDIRFLLAAEGVKVAWQTAHRHGLFELQASLQVAPDAVVEDETPEAAKAVSKAPANKMLTNKETK